MFSKQKAAINVKPEHVARFFRDVNSGSRQPYGRTPFLGAGQPSG